MITLQLYQSMSDKQLLIDNTDKHRSTIYISLLAWNTAISFFHFGYLLLYMGCIPIDTIIKVYSIDINKAVAQGLLNGCIPIGALIGAVGSAFIIQRFSRKNNIHLTNFVTFLVGFLVYIPNFYSFIFFRIIQGLCVGVYCALIPMTVREFAPTPLSGRLGTFCQLNVCIGVVIAYFLTYVLKKITGDFTCQSFWFLVFGVPQTVIVVQTILLIFVYPYDTPKYLLLSGDQTKAREFLNVIYKQEYVQQILEEKKKEVAQSKTISNSQMLSIVEQQTQATIKPSKLAFMMAIHVAIVHQLSGVNAINIYCGPILEKASSAEVALLVPTLLALVKLTASFVTSLIITRFGRKTLIQLGTFFQAVGCLMMGIGFKFQSQGHQQYEILIIAGMFLFIAVFGLTLGPLTWIYISQTAEPKYVPFATGINWATASLVIVLFPILKENVFNGNPAIAFFFFMSCCLVAVLISRVFLLETKDKTQRQIREEYINYKIC